MEFKRKVWCGTLSRTFYGKLLPYVTCGELLIDRRLFEGFNVRRQTVNTGSENEWGEIPAADVVDCQDTYLDVIDIWMNLKISEVLIWIYYTTMSVLIQFFLCIPPCHIVFKDIFLIEAWCDAPVNHIGEAHVLIDVRHKHSAQAFLLLLCFSCGILCILFEH